MALDVTMESLIGQSRELAIIQQAFHDDDLRHRLITDPAAVFGGDFCFVAEVKRFAELMIGDIAFRRGLMKAPRATAEAFGLRVDPMDLRAMWDSKGMRNGEVGDADMNSEAMLAFNAFNDMKRQYFNGVRGRASENNVFSHWRARQIERCRTEMDRTNAAAIVHAPATFELAAGCSVGCWFCGVSAEKYKGAVSYDAIKSIWLPTIAGLREVIGNAASSAFLYWGTEPFDNPDYERYCLDLKRVCGGFPQTTTAVPLRDVSRTWELLKLSTLHGCQVNRFSILTPRMLADTMRAFTPVQLLFVELVLQNRRSLLVKANAGKARNSRKLEEDRKVNAVELEEYGSQALQAANPTTIACVSGFLFNLANKSLRLISPCTASEEWPDGYIVFEEGQFEDGSSAIALMHGMVERNMHTEPEDSGIVTFRKDFGYDPKTTGFALRNQYDTISIQNPNFGPLMQRVGEMINDASWSASTIRSRLGGEFGIDDAQAKSVLKFLFDKGLLAESPAASASSS